MIDIRKAAADDIPAIRAVAEIAFPATYAGILAPAQLEYMMEWMYSESSLRRQMLEQGHIYYIAWEGEAPVGYVSIQKEKADLFHLQKIYVLPACQGKHVGQRLFRRALRAVKELHPAPCRVELNVNRLNPAVGFYRKMGMRIVRQGDFPIGGGYYMNDYIMAVEV